jgi:hypothetical protein
MSWIEWRELGLLLLIALLIALLLSLLVIVQLGRRLVETFLRAAL